MSEGFESRYPEPAQMEPMEPIDVPLAEFPRDEEVPEGCQVLEGLEPSGLMSVDLRQYTYCTRTQADGTPYDLHLYALVPCEANPLHHVNDKAPFPVVMYCQGSAWGSQWLCAHFAQHVEVARHGFVVVSVEYRPSDVASFPAQAEDFSEAIRFVRAHAAELEADVSHMAAWGDSSGAHTSLMVAYADGSLSGVGVGATDGSVLDGGAADEGMPGVDSADEGLPGGDVPGVSQPLSCVVDWYGPTDLSAMGCYPSACPHFTADCPEGMEIGGKSVRDNPDAAAAASPITYVRPGLPPTLIMHGGRDELVPFNQSCRLYERLRQAGDEVEFYKLPDANHGKALFTDPRVLAIVIDFLQRHLCGD